MRQVILFLLLTVSFWSKAQNTNRQLLHGQWQIEAIALDTVKLSLSSADDFTKALIQSKLKPSKPFKQRENDSTSLALTAAILHAQFNRLQLNITNNSEWIFNYYVELLGEDRPNVISMRFAFKTDRKLLLIDENWREEVLHLLELDENELVFTGLSHALGVTFYFKRVVVNGG